MMILLTQTQTAGRPRIYSLPGAAHAGRLQDFILYFNSTLYSNTERRSDVSRCRWLWFYGFNGYAVDDCRLDSNMRKCPLSMAM